MEMGYLFLESSEEKTHIMSKNYNNYIILYQNLNIYYVDPDVNHVGMGVAMDREKIVIVLMLSTKVLCV